MSLEWPPPPAGYFANLFKPLGADSMPVGHRHRRPLGLARRMRTRAAAGSAGSLATRARVDRDDDAALGSTVEPAMGNPESIEAGLANPL
jgi:hypothetical protein